MDNKQPRISFVVAVRGEENDNGVLVQRVGNFSGMLAQFCSKYGLHAELIVVHWNPPDGQSEPIKMRNISGIARQGFKTRLITVPSEIHKTFRNSDTMSFFEMIARNVGVRRARAPFILTTNLDVIFSEELIAFIARGNLDPKCVYTLYCHKVGSEISDMSIDEQLEWCSNHSSVSDCPEYVGDSGPFQGLQLQDKSAVRRFFKPALRIIRQQIRSPFTKPKPQAHDDVCQSFVLMSKDAWQKVRGYIEMPIHPLYLGNILIHVAVSLGFRQSILNKAVRLYHIDRGINILNLPLEQKINMFSGMPWLDVFLWGDLKRHYVNGGEPIMFNEQDWGLARHQLPEQVLS